MVFDFAKAFAELEKKKKDLTSQSSSSSLRIVDRLTSSSTNSKKKDSIKQHEKAQLVNSMAARDMASASTKQYNARVRGTSPSFFNCYMLLI